MFSISKNKTSYDYEKIFTKLFSSLSGDKKTSDNVKSVLSVILETIGSANGSLFVYQKDIYKFVLYKSYGQEPLIRSIQADFELVRYLKAHNELLFKDNIQNQKKLSSISSASLQYFTQLSCVCVAPLIVNDNWVGLFNLGRREGQKKFNQCDEKLIYILSQWFSQYVSQSILFEEIRYKNNRLEEMAKIKNQLMANVTHELRTPLNGILGLTELIIAGEDGDITEDQKRHLVMIKDSGEALLDIINNILSLIKIEADRSKVEIKKCALKPMFKEILGLFEGLNRNQNNELSLFMDDALIVFANEDQLRTVVMNLVGNATKFTKNGTIIVTGKKSGDMIKVEVSDTGIGIPKEVQGKIFTEFHQVDGSMTRGYGGTGLGLAIAKKIVELHKGRIWFESNLDEGAKFFFTIPVRPAGIDLE